MRSNPTLQVQVVVIQFDAAQREDTVILLAQVIPAPMDLLMLLLHQQQQAGLS